MNVNAYKNELLERLIEYINECGIPLNQLSKLSGINRATFYRIKERDYVPSLEVLVKYMEALNIL